MADPRVDMGSYSGQKGEESPRVFFAHGEKITVMNIIRTWVEEGVQDRSRKRFFVIDGSDGMVHTLYHDEQADGWFYKGFERRPRA